MDFYDGGRFFYGLVFHILVFCFMLGFVVVSFYFWPRIYCGYLLSNLRYSYIFDIIVFPGICQKECFFKIFDCEFGPIFRFLL